MRHTTDYRKLRNRCGECAHRVAMHRNDKGRCGVVTGDGRNAHNDTLCACRKVKHNV